MSSMPEEVSPAPAPVLHDSLRSDASPFDLPATDQDAAFVIRDTEAGRIAYAVRDSRWHVWDGRCMRPDGQDSIGRRVMLYGYQWRDVADRAIEARLGELTAEDREQGRETTLGELMRKARKDLDASGAGPGIKYACGLMGTRGRNSLLATLATVTAETGEAFDERHPGWLNCANGTVHLDGSGWHPHDPADRLAYCLDMAWRPELAGQCPKFLALVSRTCGSPEVTGYLLRCLGYALLGSNPKRKFFIIKGPTSNGKTTILTIVSRLLGSLSHESSRDLIAVTRHGRNARTENSIRGKRLITIAETSEHMTIDEAQLKHLTGESQISVNRHYALEEIRTLVTFTIFMATNEMPALPAFDAAIRERACVIPCDGPTVPEHERDETLAEQILAQEGEAVLATLIAACAHAGASGLQPPAQAVMATDIYEGSQDTVAAFISDCCLMRPEPVPAGSAPPHVLAREAWPRYLDWGRGVQLLKKMQFFDAMARQPGVAYNQPLRRFEGLSWRNDLSEVVRSMPPI